MSFKLRELGRIQFFQSSLPYLNNNAVTKFQRNHTRRWRSEDPHPSNHKFLSISNGHYGIYFTIFNHELRREEKNGLHDSGSHVLMVFPSGSLLSIYIPYFVISKVKEEVYSHIDHLKTVSKEFLSSWALVKPKHLLQQQYFIRSFTTSATEKEQEPLKITPLSQPKIEEVVEEFGGEEVPFAESFRKSQCDEITKVYNTHASPEDLDIIYPLYQALKRNDIPLPTIELYNIVLESILSRALDSDKSSLASIESKLTNLLTVYQDVLHLCSSTSLRPDSTTYNLVLKGIFEGCVETVSAGRSPSVAHHIYQEFEAKAKEFGQVGTDLFLSLKDCLNLALPSILPHMVAAITSFPELLTVDLVEKILEHRTTVTGAGSFYVGLIELSQHFASLGMPNLSPQDIHHYLISVFEDFKTNAQSSPELMSCEYNVYSALILALIANGNLSLATKFLDDILVDYKSSLQASDKNIVVAKQKVSALISVYLEAITSSGKAGDLHKAYNLMNKFNDVPYLPEFSTQLYNKLIALFINEYSMLEMLRRASSDQTILKQQKDVYSIIWNLYEKVAIRSDYQNNMYDATIYPKKFANCREYLLTLSIDLGDYSKAHRLMKEILAKDHLIGDWNVSKKLVLFLINTAQVSGNGEYIHLCWTLLEQQAARHVHDSSILNAFVSEHLPYLVNIVSEFNFERLINSKMVIDSFAKFDLSKDNIYGLMTIMTYLVNIAGSREVSSEAKLRILQYQAHLLKEFEDTENHYLQLSEELLQFKHNLINSFTYLIASSTTLTITNEITDVCEILGIVAPSSGLSKAVISMDYSHILAINYLKGVENFEGAFKAGFNFNALTWKLIINRNYVVESLCKERVMKIEEFVARLLGLSLELYEKHALLCSLISLGHEKVNIEVFKSLLKGDESGALENSRVLDALASFSQDTNNSYFLSIFEGAFQRLLEGCDNNEWASKFMFKLSSIGKLKEVVNVVSQERIKKLSLTTEGDINFLASLLTCHIALNNDNEVMAIMKTFFSDKEGNKHLMESNELLTIVVDFYISRGNYAIVVDRFGKLAKRSVALNERVKFASFMMQMTGETPTKQDSTDHDVATFAISLLSQHDVGSMNKLFELNSKFLRTAGAIFESMVEHLTAASRLTTDSRAVRAKFEAVIRLCKTMRLKELAVDHLVNVIRLLGLMDARDLLNVLVNKFVNRGETASIVNLYFLQIRVTSAHEASVLKREFESALQRVGDKINLARLAQA
ncbi:hypothetical protein C7M61_003378 [Candidozyma pseudohaemuli]|uniref:Uncharacterized protein n=1 Tax=Candidozyma pseudohaemuli TaxID=418784 RepID=A0A2P7YNY0_9ASCO|nr:hypothetical protein C7M61_003378 [[Candida] pseudohaemulonii]PSK37671.1 hypothetical protein C7M61_003378 [[Candida] pseudohaemulonii]